MSGMTSSTVTSGMTGKEGRLSARTDPLWIKTEMRSRQVGKKKGALEVGDMGKPVALRVSGLRNPCSGIDVLHG